MDDDEQMSPTEPTEPTSTPASAEPTPVPNPVEPPSTEAVQPAASDVASAAPAGPGELASKSRKGIAVVLALLLVVLVGSGAWALFAFAGSSDVLAAKAPANSLVFATIYLDPAAGQKTNLANIASQFPGGEQVQDGATSALTAAATQLGLDWNTDVKPWLGTQMAITVIGGGDTAFLINTTDEAKAEEALQKLRSSADMSDLTWQSADQNGVTISVGTNQGSQMTYAVTGETVILSESLDATKQVIDTIQGDGENLSSSADYTDTMKGLPKDSLAQAYVNLPSLLKLASSQGGMSLPGGASPLAQFDAYRGMGMSVAAEQDGIAMEVSLLTDPDKLTEAQKQAASVAPHKNAALQWTPEDSYGILSMTNLDGTLQSLSQVAMGVGSTGEAPANPILQQITDATSGDAALTVRPGAAPDQPGGTLMIATADQAKMESLLDQLATLATGGMAIDPSSIPGGWTTSDHDGTTLHTLSLPDTSTTGLAPTWAVTSEMALIGTSPEQVTADLDAKSSGSTIEQQPNFQASIAHADEMNSGMVYIDTQGIIGAVRGTMDTYQQQTFDTQVAPMLAPLKAVVMTSTADAERSNSTLFVLING